MKQKLLYLLALVMMVFTSSCEDPEHVAATVNRQGLTSVSAIFADGPYVGLELARFELGDLEEVPDVIVIPVPFFYPETSDDESAQYMTNVRVQAELAPNCSLTPGMTTMDLTKDNHFVFTDAQGNSKDIIIKGERVKSSACELLAFSLVDPDVNGVLNKATMTVTLSSGEDLSSCLATYQVSPHATIENDPAVNPRDYNESTIIKVVAHDGVTYKEYKVVKSETPKIAQGYDPNSFETLFNIDPASMLGVGNFEAATGPTLAFVKNKLIYCEGDGTTPIYVNGLNGAKEGEITLGAASAGSVTNDEGGHLLIMNKALGGEQVNIYSTTDYAAAPELFVSFTNPTTLPVGSKFKIMGNIEEDALIVMPTEGVPSVTTASVVLYITVTDGVVSDVQQQDLSALGLDWDSAPVGTAGICAVSTNPADGLLWTKYGGSFGHVTAAGFLGDISNDTTGWGLNANCLDSKTFNNQRYAALGVVSHFPSWGMGPEFYLFNITDPGKLTGDALADVPCLMYSEVYASWYQDASYSIASGDVVLAPSADGYYMYMYFVDHNSQLLVGYRVDCIQR